LIRIGISERRARLGARHHLATPAPDVVTVAHDLFGLHSSDPQTVYLAAWARVEGFAIDDLERALYEDRSLVRMLGMRRTMFVVTPEAAATMDAAAAKPLVAGERKRLIGFIEDGAIAKDGARWLDRVLEDTMSALSARREATAKELGEDVPEFAEKIHFGEGKTWGGSVGISTRVLFLLAAEGRIVRTRPLGTWRSSQYRWTPTASWLGDDLPAVEETTARAKLIRHWLSAFGPGTELDLKWWTGWNLGPTRAAIKDVDAVEVEFEDGSMGYALPGDLDPTPVTGDWVALLPGLDPTSMGWKDRDWYFGDHAAELFDRNGNAGPSVWWNGQVVGGWAQRPGGEVVVGLVAEVSDSARRAIDAKAAALTDWLDGAVVTPRFRTPLEKRLSS
jgi:DNA glycosylase AlkZ-like